MAIPLIGICLFAATALLWRSGAHSLYFGILRGLGVEPFSFPFLDADAVFAAAECQRLGEDVYISNPCDVLGRPHVYSPLWLMILPVQFDRFTTSTIGAILDLFFILSWLVLLRPRTLPEAGVLGLAAISPATIYALERANNDLAVFLLVLGAGMLFSASRPYRLCSYAFSLAAGLLKYYPFVLLSLLARERPRDALAVFFVIGSVVIWFGLCFHPELGKAFANIPAASHFTDAFSAANLPFGFAEALSGSVAPLLIVVPLGCALLAVAAARTARTLRLLERGELDWSCSPMHWLAMGSMLMAACFFAGQNIDYRTIYFLLVLPGVLHIRLSSGNASIRRFCATMIAAVLFVMWEEFFRRGLHAILAPGQSAGINSRVEVFFWLGRELVWWWLIAGLAAFALSYLRQLPLARDALSRLRRGPAAGSAPTRPH